MVFCSKFKRMGRDPFHTFVVGPKSFQMIVSDEFLKQCDTEAFLKFHSCFSNEFARLKTHTSPKNCCSFT